MLIRMMRTVRQGWSTDVDLRDFGHLGIEY
jgi:hypothetical protein